jgi:Uma2 family endonuclease
MQTETTKKLFTVDEYYRMAEAGILAPGERVELIDGEIIQMSPIGTRHAGCVNRATRLFTSAFGQRVVVSVQNPLRLNNYTEPEPDLVLLKPLLDEYSSKKPFAQDVLLVVEVADSTLAYDRNVKLPRYADAGVPEVWIEDLTNDVLLVFRNPVAGSYATSFTLHRGERVEVVALPGFLFEIQDLLILEAR